MAENTRIIDVPVLRKALLYSFVMKVPSKKMLTRSYINAVLGTEDMKQEFEEALRVMNAFYQENILGITREEWETHVVNNEKVIDYLYRYFQPNVATGVDKVSDGDPLFRFKKVFNRAYSHSHRVIHPEPEQGITSFTFCR